MSAEILTLFYRPDIVNRQCRAEGARASLRLVSTGAVTYSSGPPSIPDRTKFLLVARCSRKAFVFLVSFLTRQTDRDG